MFSSGWKIKMFSVSMNLTRFSSDWEKYKFRNILN
jgi:hypothetical protein